MRKFLIAALLVLLPAVANAKNVFEMYLDHFYPDTLAERILEEKYNSAIYSGCRDVIVKNPHTAFIISVLPGGGSFYTGDKTLGVVDLLLWPVGSTLWEMPLSWKRAKKINMTETLRACSEEQSL